MNITLEGVTNPNTKEETKQVARRASGTSHASNHVDDSKKMLRIHDDAIKNLRVELS